jgi:hypothetical protein
LTFLSFAIVAAVLLETAQTPVLAPYQTGAIKWGDARWYDRARWGKFGLLWLSVLLILAGVVEFLCATW